MKELEIKNKSAIEVSLKQKKKVEHELIGNIVPFEGHTIWEIDESTIEITKANFSNITYQFGGENKKQIIQKTGFTYVSALNKKNALKKFHQGRNGSKPVISEPLKIKMF